MTRGRRPGRGNRLVLVTRDLGGLLDTLRQPGARFRVAVAEAAAGRQILLADPSGHIVESFEYASASC